MIPSGNWNPFQPLPSTCNNVLFLRDSGTSLRVLENDTTRTRGLNNIRKEEIEPIFDLYAARTFAANYFYALQIEIIHRNIIFSRAFRIIEFINCFSFLSFSFFLFFFYNIALYRHLTKRAIKRLNVKERCEIGGKTAHKGNEIIPSYVFEPPFVMARRRTIKPVREIKNANPLPPFSASIYVCTHACTEHPPA